MIGKTLGHFHIEARAGAGGMGEVYRARDTRLDRTVAIKVLPPELAADPQRRERLKREALAISRLNHPHVCTLYDIGHAETGGDGDAVDYLVMEYMEGTPLSERTSAGALPLAEALRIAAQVADGLDAAHRLGIVHRDLKPGNVMLIASGAKLLDFGLAKESGGPAAAGTMIATRTVDSGTGGADSITAEGTILGTLQYMSPEQLHGEPADARSDLFSFGAMLYEMVTGEPPFTGKSQASVIASILEKEPAPVGDLVEVAPPALERLIHRCLAKDPEARWQNARDVMHELRWIASGASVDLDAGTADGAGAGRGMRPPVVAGIAAAAAVIALVLGALMGPRMFPGVFPGNRSADGAAAAGGSAIQPMVRAQIPLPGGYQVSGWASPTVAISDDGATVAVVGQGGEGEFRKRLFVRRLNATDWTLVPDSEFAEGPVFSPDGEWVLFAVAVSGGARNTPPELRKYSLDSGLTQTVCPVRDYFGADWHENGTIVWADQIPKGLWRIDAVRGEKENFLPGFRVDGEESVIPVGWPSFLPDGERMLASTVRGGGFGRGALVDLETGDVVDLGIDTAAPLYLPGGRVVWVDPRGAVFTAPFDLAAGRLAAAPRAVDRNVSIGGASRAVFAVADNGTAVFSRGPVAGSGRVPRRIVRVGPDGMRMDPGIEPGVYSSVGVSPDGRRLVTSDEDGLRVYDVNTGARTDIPLGEVFASPRSTTWSPDGRWIAFRGYQEGTSSLDVYVARADGSGEPLLVFDAESEAMPLDWEPDGSALLVSDFATDGSDRIRIYRAPLPAPGASGPEAPTPVNLGNHSGRPALDPDGRIVAYVQPQGGSYSAFVRTYPELGPKVALGTGGYSRLIWSADGSTLYAFVDDRVVEYRVNREPALSVERMGVVMESVEGYHQPVLNPGPLGGFWVLEELPGAGIVTSIEVVTNWVQHLP